MPVLSIFSDYSRYSTEFFHSDHVNAKELSGSCPFLMILFHFYLNNIVLVVY